MDWKDLVRAVDLMVMRHNHDEQQPLKGTSNEKDFKPVVKLFNPVGTGMWLFTEVDEDGIAFGLCDLGYPELGYADLQEIADLRLVGGLVRIEQDYSFKAIQTISQYAEEARKLGHIRA